MQLVSAGLENHPDGSGNINNIVNGNWNNIEAWFNPAAGYTASQSGTTVTASSAVFGTWDVGSTIRFADGTTDTIASVTSPTVVEVGVSRTVGSQAFYLYETGEALRGTLLRGLLGVTQIDATAHDNAFLVVNATTEKLEAVSGLTYDGSDFTFTEPVDVTVRNVDGKASNALSFTILEPPPTFVRGDANRDGTVDLSDSIRTLLYLFRGVAITCEDAADADDNEALEITDAIYGLDFLFRGGPFPPAPFPQAGYDPAGDGLGCEE